MKAQKNNLFQPYLFVAIALVMVWNSVLADDLNPPPYRGSPLSVYGHWNLIPGSTTLNLTGNNWVDDNDPSTTLSPVPFSNPVQPTTAGAYEFQLPNWIDNLPIKYMRVQLTWLNDLSAPVNVSSLALDGANPVTGQITYVSPLQPDAAQLSVYQYYDFIFQPNPDFERIQIVLQPNSVLSQVVIDTVSTVPEPGTLAILGFGAAGILRKRRLR